VCLCVCMREREREREREYTHTERVSFIRYNLHIVKFTLLVNNSECCQMPIVIQPLWCHFIGNPFQNQTQKPLSCFCHICGIMHAKLHAFESGLFMLSSYIYQLSFVLIDDLYGLIILWLFIHLLTTFRLFQVSDHYE
jgi:hypothetical protein